MNFQRFSFIINDFKATNYCRQIILKKMFSFFFFFLHFNPLLETMQTLIQKIQVQ